MALEAQATMLLLLLSSFRSLSAPELLVASAFFPRLKAALSTRLERKELRREG